jgi:hypothetical protein
VERVRNPRPRASGIGCCCILFLFLAGKLTNACSESSIPKEVSPNFSVQILNEGEAVAGLKIELSTEPKGDRESRTVLILVSDARGQATFGAVEPGLYFVGIRHSAFSSSEEILVKAHPSKNATKKITLGWPGVEPLKVQSLSGFLDGPVSSGQPLEDQVRPRYGPLGDVKLTVSSAISEELIESQVSSASGAFGFRPLAAGFYFLNIEPQSNQGSRYSMGFVPIEIDSSAKASTLSLQVFHAICGSLGYVNRDGTDSTNAQTD